MIECPICADDLELEHIPTMEWVDTARGDVDTGQVLVCPICDHQIDDYEKEQEYEPEMRNER